MYHSLDLGCASSGGSAGLSSGFPSTSIPSGTTNLLLWTEAMDDAVWAKFVVTVTPDSAANPSPPGDGSSTADLCAWGGSSRRLSQTTGITAATGTGSQLVTASGSWTRVTKTVAFDVGQYTASVYTQSVTGAGSVSLFLDVSGGFIRASLLSNNVVSFNVWGWQLETGAVATDYVPRTA